MILDNNRHVNIVNILLTEDRVFTSEELAEKVGSSSRTIKKDMLYINSIFIDNGARIVSRTNRGYSYEVFDEEKFNAFRSRVILASYYYSFSEKVENRLIFNHCIRRLLAAENGIDLDDIRAELFISDRLFSNNYRQVQDYLRSYRLEIERKSDGRVTVVGDEGYLRLCILSVYGIYYNQTDFPISEIDEYNKMFFSSQDEYQKIRSRMLAFLRTSGISIKDTASQKMALYLNLMKTRIQQGHGIEDKIEKYSSLLTDSGLYRISCELFDSLSQELDGFNVNEREKMFFAANLLYDIDLLPEEITPESIPGLYQQIEDINRQLISQMQNNFGLSVRDDDLLPVVSRMVLRKAIDMDGFKDVSLLRSYEYISETPLCVELANVVIDMIEKLIDCTSDAKDVLYCANFIQVITRRQSLHYRKRRLLTVSSLGKSYARNMAREVERMYPQLIESISPVELYEMRGMNLSDVDGVIGDIGEHAFKYDVPYFESYYGQLQNNRNSLFTAVFLEGYQAQEPAEIISSAVRKYPDMEFASVENLLSFIVYKNIADQKEARRMIEFIEHNNERFNYSRTLLPVLQVPAKAVGENRIEIYQLRKPLGTQASTPVRHVVFVAFDFSIRDDIVWAVNAFLKNLARNGPEHIDRLMEAPDLQSEIRDLLLDRKRLHQ